MFPTADQNLVPGGLSLSIDLLIHHHDEVGSPFTEDSSYDEKLKLGTLLTENRDE
jgi:hypothetical protein